MKKLYLRFRQRILPTIIGRLVKLLIQSIFATCRVEIEGLEKFTDVASKNKCLLMFWHNRLSIVTEILYRYAPQFLYSAFISNSKDGEIIAAHVNSYSIGRTIRVPHNNRAQALQKLIRHLKFEDRIIAFTPDGPKGPLHKVKPGIVIAAKEAQATIIPLSWSCSKYWCLNTWDKLMIPKPFSKIKAIFGEPICYEKDNVMVEEETKRLSHILLNLEENRINSIEKICKKK